MKLVGYAWCQSISELFDTISNYEGQGVSSIEVGLGNSCFLDQVGPIEMDQLLYKLQNARLHVNSVHAPFGSDIDFSSFDDSIHERGVASLIEAIEFTHVLGASYTIVHPGNGPVLNDRIRRLDRSTGVIRELAVIAKESGVTLAVENMPPGYLCCSEEELARLVEAAYSDAVGVCFDTGHANLSPSFEDQARHLLPYAVTMHLHDNDGLVDQHKFPGLGTIDWPSFAELRNKLNTHATMTIETMPPEGWSWVQAFERLNQILMPAGKTM
ncbi:MAG: sugar phosphate isomerase/epimerase family protein [Armatimonadota bacterium]